MLCKKLYLYWNADADANAYADAEISKWPSFCLKIGPDTQNYI